MNSNSLFPVYYEYGGIKRGQKTKSHICDDKGNVLCGVKSFWMEAGEPIVKIEANYFVKGSQHLFPINDKRHYICKKCLKNFLIINNNI
jgi:hypothetical protein